MSSNNFYLGADASKGYCDFAIVDESKKSIDPNFQLDDTPGGHQAFKTYVQHFFSRHPDARLSVGIESTGGYENNWHDLFLSLSNGLNLRACRLNPVGVNHNKKAGLVRNSTDKISARAIAEYLIDHPQNVIYNRYDPFVSLRKEWKFIRMLNKQKGQLVNHLESALYTTHPQLLTYWDHDLPRWFLMLVEKYPSAEKLARASLKSVAKIPYVTIQRAKELTESAGTSVGAEQDNVTETRIRALSQQIIHLNKSIKEQIDFMTQCASIPEVDILTSFVGIAEYSAVGLMLIIGDIKRFDSCEELASYLGVHPENKQSGDGIWEIHMSKKGSKEARCILFNVARSAIANNDMIKKLYNGYVERGKKRMVAIGIIMHKILRVVYGMLKNKTMYDPNIDEQNRKKHVEKKEKRTKSDKNRRYQKPDKKAPISKRQKKKRVLLAELQEAGRTGEK